MSNIIFYGDSITDCRRMHDDIKSLGYGYAAIVSGRLSVENPEKDVFINKGSSGNGVVDLFAQINGVLNNNPDVISILVGVNDVWRKYLTNNGIDTAKFEKVYSLLIDEFKAKFPNVKIMILEPFLLKGPATEKYYDEFRAGVEDKAKATRRIAEKYSLPFVELQDKFDKLYNPENPTYWLSDGAHPSAAGHTLIADAWLEAYKKYIIS